MNTIIYSASERVQPFTIANGCALREEEREAARQKWQNYNLKQELVLKKEKELAFLGNPENFGYTRVNAPLIAAAALKLGNSRGYINDVPKRYDCRLQWAWVN